MKVLVADKFEQTGIDGLTSAGCDVVYSPDLKDESLTRENLTQLTRTLRVSLAEILTRAHGAQQPEDWKTGIEGPLRVTVTELVSATTLTQCMIRTGNV